jgi:GT2 family glycosyltransferase
MTIHRLQSEIRNPQSEMPLAIVIPTYNQPDLLRACLVSVTRNSPQQTDIVVVDDASPADVARVVAEFRGVRHLRLTRRGGFCVAANAGIAATTAPIVELLNDDTEVCPDWASAALRAFDDPRVAAVAPLVVQSDGRVDSAGDRYDPGGFAQKIGHGESINESMLQRRAVFGASASSAFYRRTFLERVGLFPESFGAYFEDVDLACRLQRAGGTVIFEPESRVIHHGGSSHGPLRRQMIEQQSRNEEWLYWRNTPSVLQTLPRHVAVLAAKALRRWNEGRLVPWLCGRARALWELRECRQHARSLAAINPALHRALERAHPKS